MQSLTFIALFFSLLLTPCIAKDNSFITKDNPSIAKDSICISKDIPGISKDTLCIRKDNPCIAKNSISIQDALAMGLTEGATEFLPISSTAHLILLNHFLGLDKLADPQLQKVLTSLSVIVQLGAILAALVVFRKNISKILKGFTGQDPQGLSLGKHLIYAFIPTGALGFMLEGFIESHLRNLETIILSLVLGAVLMLATQAYYKKKRIFRSLYNLSAKEAVFIGCMQGLALCPGTSRSMMTIVAGLLLGLKASDAVIFSFLLGLVTISVAALYKMLSYAPLLLGYWHLVGVTCVAAFISALGVSYIFVGLFPRVGLRPFAYYRMFLACLLLVVLYLK